MIQVRDLVKSFDGVDAVCGISFDVEPGQITGYLGPNGAQGGANAYAKMGRKANVGHTHQAGIRDGIYTGGTLSYLDLGYNRGPSSWSHSNIITYVNGKRTIITMWNGKWRA